MSRTVRISLKVAGILLGVYLLTCAGAYWALHTVVGTEKLMSAAGPVMFRAYPLKRLITAARAGELQVGQPAPDFELEPRESPAKNGEPKQNGDPDQDSDPDQDIKTERVRLSSFQGKKPVVLIFGSYT